MGSGSTCQPGLRNRATAPLSLGEPLPSSLRPGPCLSLPASSANGHFLLRANGRCNGDISKLFQTTGKLANCLFFRPRMRSPSPSIFKPLIRYLLAHGCPAFMVTLGTIPTCLTPVCALSPWQVTSHKVPTQKFSAEKHGSHLTFLPFFGTEQAYGKAPGKILSMRGLFSGYFSMPGT